jgi:hypothetical protein
MGKKGSDAVTGYKYHFGIHMGLSRGPLDTVSEIRVGDKPAWYGFANDTGPLDVRAPDLFGGDKQEGGIDGTGVLMMGKPDQVADPGLVAMLGHALPGFRRMATYFFNGAIASNSPYPKPWKFRVTRRLKGWDGDVWYPEKCTIDLQGDPIIDELGNPVMGTGAIQAMNPAHIIYELLTNREWGRGLPASALNLASFAAAADTLYDEGFGLCLRWNRRDSLESFLQSVADHIGAVLYSDRSTAQLTLKLIRFDYDPNTLPIYDVSSGLLEIRESNVSALGPAVNEIVVEYFDPVSAKVRTVANQNIASLQATRGVFNSLKKTYNGVSTSSLALRLAQRDLRTHAMALRKFTMTFDRRAWKIAPGSVMRIADPVRGISNVIVRVGRIEDGTLTDGTITITAVQDVFALPNTSFIGNEPPNWVKPNNKPTLKEHRAFEVPYFLLNQTMRPADFAILPEDAGFLGTVVAKPSDLSLAYNLFVKNGPATPDEQPPSTP